MSDVYLGNPNLKKKGVQVDFTQEQIAEYVKCADDPIHFIKNYIKVVHVDKGLIDFDLYMFSRINKCLICVRGIHEFTEDGYDD